MTTYYIVNNKYMSCLMSNNHATRQILFPLIIIYYVHTYTLSRARDAVVHKINITFMKGGPNYIVE